MKQKEVGMVIMIAFIVTVMGCEKDIPGSVSDKDRAESHLDTLGFRLLYTEQLVHCMLINDTELQRDSFLVETDTQLEANFPGNSCIDYWPDIHFQDSVVIGYKTMVGGSGTDIERLVVYNRSTNSVTYSITAFTNDTALLSTKLNWITLPKYDFDSVVYKLKIMGN
ncbi:hypothetical protein [Membranihabitans maritimus]|uniref:hypothetical protein n=1 Tax=Membranihabitans maritimus TaxID=2904244 RepID=UPI001F4656DA|nr:hypothetical protein [Membranihabitans maritimus]